MMARTSHILLVFSAFLAGLVIFLGVILFTTHYQGTGLGPSAIGGPFKLIDENGKPITDQDMKGRPFLVFFGYRHCPDICPTTLFEMSEVMRALSGGLDSSAITLLAGRFAQGPVECFSLKYEGDEAKHDESEFAAAAIAGDSSFHLHWVCPTPST